MEKNTLKIFTDGGSRGNPGPAAAAYVIFKNSKIIKQDVEYLGNTTNNQAEYTAVTMALKWLVDNQSDLSFKKIYFYIDSELVVNQLMGSYKVKNVAIEKYVFMIQELIRKVDKEILFRHVVRSKNKVADKLVNQKLDQLQEISR